MRSKLQHDKIFEIREDLDIKHDGIPAEHNRNIDEKGNQMGGGQRLAASTVLLGATRTFWHVAITVRSRAASLVRGDVCIYCSVIRANAPKDEPA